MREDGKAIIIITHKLHEVMSLSDRVAIMKNGKLLICDTADQIKKTANTDRFEEAFIRIVKEG